MQIGCKGRNSSPTVLRTKSELFYLPMAVLSTSYQYAEFEGIIAIWYLIKLIS